MINAHWKNSSVKAAVDALQAGDVAGWKEMFEANTILLDYGHPRDLDKFSEEAVDITN